MADQVNSFVIQCPTGLTPQRGSMFVRVIFRGGDGGRAGVRGQVGGDWGLCNPIKSGVIEGALGVLTQQVRNSGKSTYNRWWNFKINVSDASQKNVRAQLLVLVTVEPMDAGIPRWS